MGDFQVLLNDNDSIIEKSFWGSTHVPNKDIDPEHYERWWRDYVAKSGVAYYLDTGSFVINGTPYFINGPQNYSHYKAIDDGGKIIKQEPIDGIRISVAHDAMGIQGVDSNYVIWTPRSYSETFMVFPDDATIFVYVVFRPNEFEWEGRVYFGNNENPSPNSPGYFLGIKEHTQYLSISYDGTYKSVAQASLFSHSSISYKRLGILIHPSRNNRLYITNIFAPQTNKFYYKVDFNSALPGTYLCPIIPSGPVGLYAQNADVIFVVGYTLYTGTNTHLFGPVLTLPYSMNPYQDVVIKSYERNYPSTQVKFGFSDRDGNIVSEETEWLTDSFRWYAHLSTTNKWYTPEIYRIMLYNKAQRIMRQEPVDITHLTMAININLSSDLVASSGSVNVKEDPENTIGLYSQKAWIPIKIMYQNQSKFWGVIQNTSLNRKKLHSSGSINFTDFWKRLEFIHLGNVPAFDGMLLTDVYEHILYAAGLGNKQLNEGTPNFDIYDDGIVTLPVASNDAEPLFMLKPSTSVAQFLLELRDNLTFDLIYFSPDGTLKIEKNWSAYIPGTNIPEPMCTFYTYSSAINDRNDPYYTVREFSQSVNDDDFANVVYVTGYDDDLDKPIIAMATDYESINNPNAPNYIGWEKEAWYFNSKLNTRELVNIVCLYAYEYLRNMKVTATWKSAWNPDLKINDVISFSTDDPSLDDLNGSKWRLTGINIDISSTTLQRPIGKVKEKYWEAQYQAERVYPLCKTIVEPEI